MTIAAALTVGQLLEQLQPLDPNLPVFVATGPDLSFLWPVSKAYAEAVDRDDVPEKYQQLAIYRVPVAILLPADEV